MSTVIVHSGKKQHNWLVRLLWFLFIGWWLGELWILVAWMLMAIIIGIPLAVKMLNKLPKVITLKEPDEQLVVTVRGGTTVITTAGVPQRNILVRALWFVLIGCWFSFIWMELAYLACLTFIGLPLGFWMFDKVPAIVSLRR